MMNISLNTVYRQFMLKIGVTVLASLLGQTALAVCATNESPLSKINTNNDDNGNTIYFCAETFTKDDDLAFKPRAEDIVTGGNQAREIKNNSIQAFPLSSKIDLKGFNVDNLDFKKVVTYLPNPKAMNSEPYLFEFYARILQLTGLNSCSNALTLGNQYSRIKQYLLVNSSKFTANKKSFTAIQNSNDIAKAEGVFLEGPLGSKLAANVYLYHASPTTPNEGFRDGTQFYCRVGIKARVELLPSDTDLTNSGEHKLNIKFESGN